MGGDPRLLGGGTGGTGSAWAALLPLFVSSCCQGDLVASLGPGLAPLSWREPQGVLMLMTRDVALREEHFLEGEGVWLHRCLCLWSVCEPLKEASSWGTQAHPTAECANRDSGAPRVLTTGVPFSTPSDLEPPPPHPESHQCVCECRFLASSGFLLQPPRSAPRETLALPLASNLFRNRATSLCPPRCGEDAATSYA